MTLLDVVNVFVPLLGLLGIILIAHKNKRGFVVFFFVEAGYFYMGYMTEQYGLIATAVMYFISNIYSLWKWRTVK